MISVVSFRISTSLCKCSNDLELKPKEPTGLWLISNIVAATQNSFILCSALSIAYPLILVSSNSPNNLSNENVTQKTSIDSLYDLIDIHNIIKEKSKTKDDTEYTEPLPAYDCDFNPPNDIVSFTEVMNMINQFCAKSNVNIPITIPDLNDLFKAYALINGLAGQINYDSLRMGNVIKKILYDYENIENVVKHPVIVISMYNTYLKENKKYSKVLEKISMLDNSNRNIDLD